MVAKSLTVLLLCLLQTLLHYRKAAGVLPADCAYCCTSTVGFPLESMMYLPFTPVMADMWRASTGLAARAAAPDMVESIVAIRLVWEELLACVCKIGRARVNQGGAESSAASRV